MYVNQFAQSWQKLSKEMKTYMDSELSPTITESQLHVLELLETNERMKPSDFVEHLSTTPAAVTTLIDRMEKNQLILRDRDPKDRRKVWVTATEKGKNELHRGIHIREKFLTEHLDRISIHNQQLLVYLLGKVSNS